MDDSSITETPSGRLDQATRAKMASGDDAQRPDFLGIGALAVAAIAGDSKAAQEVKRLLNLGEKAEEVEGRDIRGPNLRVRSIVGTHAGRKHL